MHWKDHALPAVFLMAVDWARVMVADVKVRCCGVLATQGGCSSCDGCSGLFDFLQLG
jgi:hypothetical protein